MAKKTPSPTCLHESVCQQNYTWHNKLLPLGRVASISSCFSICWILCGYFWLCYACSVAQLCPTLCDPIDCSPPGSSVHGMFQARTLEWLWDFFLSPGTFLTRDQTHVSCISCSGRWFLYHCATWNLNLMQNPSYMANIGFFFCPASALSENIWRKIGMDTEQSDPWYAHNWKSL